MWFINVEHVHCQVRLIAQWTTPFVVPQVVKTLLVTLGKKATIHQVTTMLSTYKNVLFPGHSLTTC